MKRIQPKHPLAIRCFHWINFPVLAMMVWSGLLIYWAYDPYKIHIGNLTLIQFFPDSFYKAFDLNQRLGEGMAWHFTLMWVFMLNGLAYVGYTWLSGEWRALLPGRNAFKEAWQVVLHDLGLRKHALPERKFNAAQQIAYTSVILMGIGSLLTGIAIYKPIQASTLTWLLGGYKMARLEHFTLTMGYVLFFVIHLLQVIRAGWNNFQAMVTGFEIKEEPEVSSAQTEIHASPPSPPAP
jgi:thiosulfate reductase cytochrome b subunit